MSELRDSNTGEVITPDQITAQLQNMGVEVDAKPQEEVTQEKTDEAPEVLEGQHNRETSIEIEDIEDDSEAAEIAFNSVEEEAAAKGWKPNGPKSADEFLRAEPLYEELKSRGKEIKELKSTLDELKAHMDKQKELGYKQAMQELYSARKEAIEMGDVESVDNIDLQIREHEEEANTLTHNPHVQEFADNNKAWINDPSYEAQKIREFAQHRDEQLVAFNLDPSEHLRILEKDVKKEFSSYFGEDTIKSEVSSVESDIAPTSPSSKKYSFKDLNADQKDCYRHFTKRGIMSGDQYIKSLIESGEL